MKVGIKLLDVVALLRDNTEKALVAGQVGTVVELLEEGVFEVDFSDGQGRTYAIAALKEAELILLHYSPVAA